MNVVSGFGLVDLIALVLVASSVVGALTARRGIVAAVLSGAGTVLVCWLVCLGLVAWGPSGVRSAVGSSTLLQLLPVPHLAIDQARAVGHWVGDRLGGLA